MAKKCWLSNQGFVLGLKAFCLYIFEKNKITEIMENRKMTVRFLLIFVMKDFSRSGNESLVLFAN